MDTTTKIPGLLDHLFRVESGKLIAVLTGVFGAHYLELAEDVVQDTLADALSVWDYKGIPQNPGAWLYTVAKNKALNIIRREKYHRKFTTEAARLLTSQWTTIPTLDHLFSQKEIADDQLRMMFTCCHPAITTDSQIALILKTLCGFSIPEIARAFLSAEDSINKRLVRARQKIRDADIAFEMPEGEGLHQRAEAVLQAIYLLFNEGYKASSGDDLIRYELCEEAIRLAEMLAVHPAIPDKSDTNALLALMLFNASRFHSRQDREGNILPMSAQDRSGWNAELIRKGFYYIGREPLPEKITPYHILAAISAHHCSSPDFASTDWASILLLYDSLVEIDPSPVVRLNRTIALSKVQGPESALDELGKIKQDPFLQSYYLYHASEAEFHMQLGQPGESAKSLRKAIDLAPLKAEKDLLEKKLEECRQRCPF